MLEKSDLIVGNEYEVIASITGENQNQPNDWEFVSGDVIEIVEIEGDVVIGMCESGDTWGFFIDEFMDELVGIN